MQSLTRDTVVGSTTVYEALEELPSLPNDRRQIKSRCTMNSAVKYSGVAKTFAFLALGPRRSELLSANKLLPIS